MSNPVWKHRVLPAVTTFLTIAWLGACTETVYKDRPPFNPPPDAQSGFLGYYTADEKQTTCGNCHVGQQADWIKTAHSGAWDDLQASPENDATCKGSGCHTVNWRGNQDSAVVGYDKVQNKAYFDVQCESCHGPGELHVTNPSITANHPLASMNVTDDPALEARSCSGCHKGGAGPDRHQNYLKEWRSTRHGKLNAYPAGNTSCQPCHEGKGALQSWGIQTNYQEKGTSLLLGQNCVVCHDPHGTAQDDAGNTLPGQLRFPIDTRDIGLNLCTKCHGRVDRAEPGPSPSARGGHGLQGPVVFGEAGYWPVGSGYDTLIFYATHGSTGNSRLCAGCHVNKLTGVDDQGNSITFSGHSFHPIPCLQSKTPEIVDTTYNNSCNYDVPSRSWQACTGAGCHTGGETVAQALFTNIRTEIDQYAKTLWVNSSVCSPNCSYEVVDAFPADSGYLAKIKLNFPNELDYAAPNLLTPAKGAVFNVQAFGEGYSGHPDGSKGIHNPFLYRAALQANIAELLATYPGLPAPPAPILASIQAAVESGALRLAPKELQAVQRAALAQQSAQTYAGTR